eukprot:6418988-Amphidinium_carterae.1
MKNAGRPSKKLRLIAQAFKLSLTSAVGLPCEFLRPSSVMQAHHLNRLSRLKKFVVCLAVREWRLAGVLLNGARDDCMAHVLMHRQDNRLRRGMAFRSFTRLISAHMLSQCLDCLSNWSISCGCCNASC